MTLDDDLVQALRTNPATAPLPAAERAIVDYVIKLTRDAKKIGPADLDGLRSFGFDDQAVLQITLIASWFNYINRVADALGVGREQGERMDPSAQDGLED